MNWYLTLQHFEVTTSNTNEIYRIKQNWEFSWIPVSSGKQAGAEFGQAQPNWYLAIQINKFPFLLGGSFGFLPFKHCELLFLWFIILLYNFHIFNI